MRELVGRASFGHIRCVIRPVLRFVCNCILFTTADGITNSALTEARELYKIIYRHLDNHQLWVPNYFAIHTFRIIMFSIQVSGRIKNHGNYLSTRSRIIRDM